MNPPSTKLEAEIVPTGMITAGDREQMFALMSRHFSGLESAGFERDLAEKPWTILLRNAAGRIQGFSTLDLMESRVGGRVVRAVYSGDTVIDSQHRATTALPRAFLRFIARHTGAGRDEADWYWFYVCKGFRTYRFLPVFYQRFSPHPAADTPEREKQVMDRFASERFGDAYDPSTGVVAVPGDYALRDGVGDITQGRLQNAFVRHFTLLNPGWMKGDELVCLASLDRLNFQARPLQWLDGEAGT